MRWRASSPRSCRPRTAGRWSSTTSPARRARSAPARSRKAEPDGHTIVLGTNQTHATNAILLKDAGYDPLADFMPIAGLADLQHALVVRKDLPAASVARADRARQEGPRQAQLRLDRRRLRLAPRHGAVQDQDRHRHGACRLPRRRADGDRDRRRAHRRGVLDTALGAGADPVRRHAGAGHRLRQQGPATARRAAAQGAGRDGRRGRRLARAVRPGQDAGRRARRARPRPCWPPSPSPRWPPTPSSRASPSTCGPARPSAPTRRRELAKWAEVVRVAKVKVD